ncbi:MAG: hypothetical protein H6622_12070 [Halobacteriovoraceae bacterium]|nr:hypothetical protein [Halobacteriovoraceae bacterium]
MKIVFQQTLIFSFLAALTTNVCVALGIFLNLEGFLHLANFASFSFFSFTTFCVFLIPTFMGISLIKVFRKSSNFQLMAILISLIFGLGSKFIYFNINYAHIKSIQFPLTAE